jgi:hypothetical protein
MSMSSLYEWEMKRKKLIISSGQFYKGRWKLSADTVWRRTSRFWACFQHWPLNHLCYLMVMKVDCIYALLASIEFTWTKIQNKITLEDGYCTKTACITRNFPLLLMLVQEHQLQYLIQTVMMMLKEEQRTVCNIMKGNHLM